MMGRCLLDQGRFEEATHEFMIALDHPDLPAEAEIGLRYHLGLALEAAGKLREAMREFERVFAMQANYSDVALKLRTMRKALEAA
jgi:tetratricopeptide (TPR) repeat protein